MIFIMSESAYVWLVISEFVCMSNLVDEGVSILTDGVFLCVCIFVYLLSVSKTYDSVYVYLS